jgi:hypothetical protein
MTMRDDAFLAAFEAGRLDPKAFNHKAHVLAGWLYVRRYPLTEAIARFSHALKAFARRAGSPMKYHETITWFYMLLIAERQGRGGYASFAAFARDNEDLVADPSVLSRYYTSETLASTHARTHYVMPDRGQEALAA